MKSKEFCLVFDLSGTLVKMRPPRLLIKKILLTTLSKSARLGIVTGAKRAETENILTKLRIKNCFDFIVTKDESPYRKPDKRLFEKARGKIDPEKIIYVGDTKKDFVFTRNAKIKFCYVGKRKYGIYQNKDIDQILNFIVKNFLK